MAGADSTYVLERIGERARHGHSPAIAANGACEIDVHWRVL
jgi:hypothetical protein